MGRIEKEKDVIQRIHRGMDSRHGQELADLMRKHEQVLKSLKDAEARLLRKQRTERERIEAQCATVGRGHSLIYVEGKWYCQHCGVESVVAPEPHRETREEMEALAKLQQQGAA